MSDEALIETAVAIAEGEDYEEPEDPDDPGQWRGQYG